jgi:L-rhamnose mutarotase
MKGEHMRVALHTRRKPGREAGYEQVHAVIPSDLEVALRDAGAILRDGLELS